MSKTITLALTLMISTIVLAMMLACAGIPAAAPAIPSKTYDANGVTFNYPQSWQEISPSQLSVYVTDYTYLAVLADQDKNGGTVARFVIVQTDTTFDDYLASERAYYVQHYKDSLAEKTTSVAGMSATQFETTGAALSGDKMKSLNIYFEYNHRIYYLTFSTPLANYEKAKPGIDLVVNSFKIK